MSALLLGAAARAAEAGLAPLAAEAVHETTRWGRARGRLAVAAYAGVPTLRIMKGALSARIFRWARRVSKGEAPRPAAPLAASRNSNPSERKATNS